MTHLERVAALEHRGYPPRHAAFLELVMLHGGYFMRRQVMTFLRRRDGGVTSDFLWHLVRRHAVRVGVGRRRAHLYQVFPKPLYAVIGEAENRNRRLVMPPMVIRKLMTLDLVLGGPSLTWLATEEEKIRHLTEVCHVPRSALPGTWYPGRAPFVGTVRYFVDKAPMSVRPDGEVAFAYVQGLDHSLVGLRGFLDRYVGVLSVLPKARVVWVVARGVPFDRFEAVMTGWRDRVEARRSRWVSELRDDLYAYCVCRQRLETGQSTNPDSDRRIVARAADPGRRTALPGRARRVPRVRHGGDRGVRLRRSLPECRPCPLQHGGAPAPLRAVRQRVRTRVIAASRCANRRGERPMTSRLASRPASPPRPLRRGRGSSRVTSGRRAVCARRSHLSPPCAVSLSEVTLRGGARVGATPPLASPAPAILAGPVGPNSTGSLPPSPVGDVVESDDELIKSPSVRFAGRSCRTCGSAFALRASARPTRSIAKRAEWRARFAQARPAIIIRLSGKTSRPNDGNRDWQEV